MNGFTKLKAPENFGAINVNNRLIQAEPDGSVLVLHDEVDILKSHGFADWDGDSTITPLEAMSRHQLVAEVWNRTQKAIQELSDDKLRKYLSSNGADITLKLVPPETEGAGSAIVPTDVTVDKVQDLHRTDLFKFLKAQGVKTEPKMTNDDLRALALQVFAGKVVDKEEEDAAIFEEVTYQADKEFPFADK